MYDGVYPEYFLTFTDAHLDDPFKALKEMLTLSPYIWIAMGGIGIFYFLFSNSRVKCLNL